jgi:hypothetical protein
MELKITRNNSKPHIILYKRDDGSETWMHANDYFIVHDLSHFAIEKTLHYKTAFMGMLNKGLDIKDFENREKRRRIALTDEAAHAENMANLFLMEVLQGRLEDFNRTVSDSFIQMNGISFTHVLSEAEIASVRNYLRELISEWKALPAGHSMSLFYDFEKQ